MKQIRMLVFDIDGVITDGKRYISGDAETKSIALKDLDALRQLRDAGYQIGCISGEDTEFSRRFVQLAGLHCARLGCKEKNAALAELARDCRLTVEEACYIGDGKYDIPALEDAGLAVCPADATAEVKRVADVILSRRGGEGCIAECYTLLTHLACRREMFAQEGASAILRRMNEHRAVLTALMEDCDRLRRILEAAEMIADSYAHRGKVFFCGNGGSAADAQHLAGELVGRFYLERRALNAEALTTNTSILTALANDYDYDMIFARQLEAKAERGDILIGLSTSGTSSNVLRAFEKAKEMGVQTVLMTGEAAQDLPVMRYTDCLLDAPSRDTPRIQEMHILMGHILCELVEQEIAAREKI